MRRVLDKTRWYNSGTPWVWLNAGALAISLIMVLGILLLITVRGFGHFWPSPLYQFEYIAPDNTKETVIGARVRSEKVAAAVIRDQGIEVSSDVTQLNRYLVRKANRDLKSQDFQWFLAMHTQNWQTPDDLVVLERRQWGPFYGRIESLLENNQAIAKGADAYPLLAERIQRTEQLIEQRNTIEQHRVGQLHDDLQKVQSALKDIELTQEQRNQLERQLQYLNHSFTNLYEQLDALQLDIERDSLRMRTANDETHHVPLSSIVSAAAPNTQSFIEKLLHYIEAVWTFISSAPREANTEGGIFPAIVGTLVMVLLMSVLVTPLGVFAAVYLHEYAKQGMVVRLVRLSVYNLAGVPSIVLGVFGLGFFVYGLGGSIDELFFAQTLPSPTFGTPGLFWASLTMALLTLPVVIVSTEEGLARVPDSLRMGSMALGATRSETLWRVVLPLTLPAMMTGLILAVARAAGEVAPLMLVGVVKFAPSLPIDGEFPYVHLDQKIMHLGFHIYDAAYQSPNVEAAMPLVYATALVLIALIMTLNTAAIIIRNRLREKYSRQVE